VTLAINTGVSPAAWIEDPAAAVTAADMLREQARTNARRNRRRA
jgi:hypothetical protein